MSVLIKGMSLPDNCYECPCLRHDSIDGINAYQCNLTLNTYDDNTQKMWTARDEDCPLVEVHTPHGRLIDADELLKEMNLAIAMMSGMMKTMDAEDDGELQMELKAYRDIRDGIKGEPVVIEAEGGEQ